MDKFQEIFESNDGIILSTGVVLMVYSYNGKRESIVYMDSDENRKLALEFLKNSK